MQDVAGVTTVGELLKLGPAGLLLIGLFVMLKIIVNFQRELNTENGKTRQAQETLLTSMFDSLKSVTSMQQTTATATQATVSSLQAVATELRGIVSEAKSLVGEVKSLKSKD